MKKFISLILLFSHATFAAECEPEKFNSDLEAVVAEVTSSTTVKIDLSTKGEEAGLVSFSLKKEFAPPTQERFDQIVNSLSSEKALNGLDSILEQKRSPSIAIKIEAHSGEPKEDGTYKMKTDTWINGFKGITAKQSIMNCSKKASKSSWLESCAIDLQDPATVKYVSSGNRSMGCELVLGKKIICITKFSAHPKPLNLPMIVRPIARKVAGTSDLSASQLAYKTVQRSLSLLLAMHEHADAGGAPTTSNLLRAADSARGSPFYSDVEGFIQKLPKSEKDPVPEIHYVKSK